MKLPGAHVILALAMTVSISAQQRTSHRQQGATQGDLIAELTAHLQFSPSAPDQRRLYAELDGWTDRFVAEVDNYIQRAFRPQEGSLRIQARLRAVLASHVPNPEYGDLPLAQLADLPSGRVLLVAYTIVRGSHHNLPIVRAYQWDTTKFRRHIERGAVTVKVNDFVSPPLDRTILNGSEGVGESSAIQPDCHCGYAGRVGSSGNGRDTPDSALAESTLQRCPAGC
jgi:hypothetical protein